MNQADAGVGTRTRRSPKVRKSSGLRKIATLVAIALVLVTAVLLIRRLKKPVNPPDTPIISSIPALTATEPFQLEEASIDSATHRIKGVVKNISGHAYQNVHIVFRTLTDNGDRGLVSADIATIQPHAGSSFVTGPLPANTKMYYLPPEMNGELRQ